ncbi:MAG: hypothetical protein ABI540_09165 [Spartobacteria bacterium]
MNSFVIRLTDTSPDRSFTFVTETAATEGQLNIAVSDRRLGLDSPKWRAVEGEVRFRQKRRFTLSLVGVEANYVRLTFQLKSQESRVEHERSGARSAAAEPAPEASAFLQGVLVSEQLPRSMILRP